MARIVLVADDSPTIQKRALAILKGEGFEVETVSNGVAAIKRLAVLHPVVILADVSMPGRDGYEVCDFVKKSPELSHVPVLLVASDMEPYDDAKGAQVRADGIIKKPFEAHELISLVLKFAGQFEAETIRLPASPIVPPQPQERTQEFTAFSEAPDDEPTIRHHAEPDFSAQAGGVAFAQSGEEGAHVHSPVSYPYRPGMPFPTMPETAPAFAESAFEPASGFDEVQPVTAEAASATKSFSPQPSPPAAFDRSPPGDPEAATQEPVFIEEQPAPASHHHGNSGAHTMIFRTPLAIADPEWKDETVPAPRGHESAGPMALEPQLEAESAVAPAETPAEQASESNVASVTATSLDSFSLDDAAAGQVHFHSHGADPVPLEHMHFGPSDEASAMGVGPLEASPQAADASPIPPDPAEEPLSAKPAPSEATREPVQAAIAQPDAPRATVYAESVPCDSAPEARSPEAASEQATMGTVNTAAAASGAEPKPSPTDPAPETTAPTPTFDWDLFYLVVHKAVVKMSPPILPADLIEEIARRIADEIAIEITSGSPHTHA